MHQRLVKVGKLKNKIYNKNMKKKLNGLKFITREELGLGKFESCISDLSGEDDSRIIEYEKAAMEKIDSYLYGRYDTFQIFNKVGEERSSIIKKVIIDFIICDLFDLVNYSETPQRVLDNCAMHTKWLSDLSKGIISANLPKLDNMYQQTTTFKGGSESRFNDISYQ